MHFHHRHDIDGCTDAHTDWPDYAAAILATLDRRELQLMSQIQDQIDALASQLATAAADVQAKLDDVENQLAAATAEPTVDLSALQAAVAQVAALVPAPVPEPQPAVDPQPVDQGTPAAQVPSA